MRRTALVLLAFFATAPALGQPIVPGEFVDRTRPLRGDRIVLCIWPDSPMFAFDRAVGTALADSQLIDAEFVEIQPQTAGSQDVFEVELYINLMNNCDAAMGGSLEWRPLPTWLTITGPYYETRYVLAVRDPAIASADQLPDGSRVGAVLLSPADMTLATALAADMLPALRRIPYDTPQRILRAVAAGDLDAGIVPEHAIAAFLAAEPDAGLHAADLAPLPIQPEAVGILLPSNEIYLRELLDAAIEALTSDGTLEALAAEAGFPMGGQ